MIELATRLKLRHGLRIAVVSNEARELNAYRIRKIFRLALDIAQASARQVLYIENTPMFVQIAEGLGGSKHSSHGLQVHLRETDGIRVAE
jgi:putative hydrolase of the HAD superfamily